MSKLLEIADLSVTFGQGETAVEAVKGASLSIEKGEAHALVGESGSGKSVTALSVMQATGLPTWCAVSLGNMAGAEGGRRTVHPEDKAKPRDERRFLPSVEPDLDRPAFEAPRDCFELLLLADADGSDLDVMRRHMRRAVARQAARGASASVAWPRPGCDFNDLLREGTQDAA